MSSGARRSDGPWAHNLWGGTGAITPVVSGKVEDRQEEGWEVESRVGRVKEKQPLTCMAWRWGEKCKTHSRKECECDDQGL